MSSSPAYSGLLECLSTLSDPRVERTRYHSLLNILTIAICACLCGAEGWEDMNEFGRAKREWLEKYLDLSNGIPSADTFRRVFSRVDPIALQECFRLWSQSLHELTGGEVIALDGKTLRHSFASGCGPIHIVSAWASEARLVLGQLKVEEKTNEIPMVPALLRLLEIKGCIVTADALNCQTATAETIIEKGGDYILAVKGNQKHLYEDIMARFAYGAENKWRGETYEVYRRTEKDHGRIETRICEVIFLGEQEQSWGDVQEHWVGLRSLVRVTSTRQLKGKLTTEERYYISSLTSSAKNLSEAVRAHWGIENKVHYVLDVSFREDACRIRSEHGAENLAVLRHIALNLLRQEKLHKRGIKARQKKAGWDNSYLEKILVS